MVSSLYTSSSLRIGGLASGIDTDSIMRELMKAHRIPLDRLNQDRQILLWQQEDYRAIYDSLRAFRDKVFNMKLQATYQAKQASSSNEAAVSASATTSAVPGMYTVTVTQLATGVSKVSQGDLNDETKTDGTIKTLAEQFPLLGEDKFSFTLVGYDDGTTIKSAKIELDPTKDTIYTVVSKINDAKIGIAASYDATLNRFFLATSSTGANYKIKVTDDSKHLPVQTRAGTEILMIKVETT
jgi:Flagellar capping protein